MDEKPWNEDDRNVSENEQKEEAVQETPDLKEKTGSEPTAENADPELSRLNEEDEESLKEAEAFLPMIIEQIEEEQKELSELEQKRKAANKIVLGFTASAGATGAIPIPLADAPLLIGQQVAMIAALSDLYQINLKKSGLKSLVFTVLGVSGTTVLGKTITGSLFKAIPGIGTLGGALLFGGTAAALTAALGEAYSELCERVFLGEIDETQLLGHEGRAMLETSFKNHLRLEMDARKQEEKDKEDVLKKHPVPEHETPIEMSHKTDDEPVPDNGHPTSDQTNHPEATLKDSNE